MKRFFYSHEPQYYHVSGKCTANVWPSATSGQVWQLFNEIIQEFYETQKVKTHAFVMMSNHYHWLCSVDQPIEPANEIFKNFHRTFNFDYKHSFHNEVLTESPSVQVLDHIESYRNAFAYIYRNPVSAGLVERAEHYPYSTLAYVLGRESDSLQFHCHDNMNLIIDPKRMLEFINKSL